MLRVLLVMTLTYERLYNGKVYQDQPVPAAVREGAERQVEYLLPSREHMLYTRDGREFRRGSAWSSECWRVTFTPAPVIGNPAAAKAGRQSDLF